MLRRRPKFQNHIPVRGRKLFLAGFEPRRRDEISKPYPRKGTETFRRSSETGISMTKFQNHIPVRGRKLLCPEILYRLDGRISKPYPRKGTETFDPFLFESCNIKFQNHIPVRGRKLLTSLLNLFVRRHFKTISP